MKVKHLPILAILLTAVSFAASPVIWYGTKAKFLTPGGIAMNGADDKSIIDLGTVDPTIAPGSTAAIGSIAFSKVSGTGQFYVKQGAVDTAWAIAAGGVVPSRQINTAAPISGGGDLTANRTISISKATNSTDGYLSSNDWNMFNLKQNELAPGSISESTSSVLTITNGSTSTVGPNVGIQVKKSSAAQDGYLSSNDWNMFDAKQNQLAPGSISEATSSVLTITNGSTSTVGPNVSIEVKQASAGQSGYLSSADWSTFNGKQDPIGFTPEDVANKSTDGTLVSGSTILYPSVSAVKTYSDTSLGQKTHDSLQSISGGAINNYYHLTQAEYALATQLASGSTTGLLSPGDWSTFNGKQNALTPGSITESTSSVLTITNGSNATVGPNTTIQVKQSSAVQDGFLSSGDWSTFNSKQNSLTFGNLTDAGTDGISILGGTGAVIGAGATISQQVSDSTHNGYLSSVDWSTFNGKQSALTIGNLTGTTNRTSVSGGTGAVIGTGAAVDVDTSLLPSPLIGDVGKVLKATGANAASWQTQSAGVADHESLTGLQGGAVNNHYHMTQAQNALATQLATGSTTGLLGPENYGRFDGKAAYTPNQYGVLVSGSTTFASVIAPGSSSTQFLRSGGLSASPLWSDINSDVIKSGSTTAGNVLTANGAGATYWALPPSASNVVTTYGGQMVANAAYITCATPGADCTVVTEYGDWISGNPVRNGGDGEYTITFNAGIFSQAPICTANNTNSTVFVRFSTVTFWSNTKLEIVMHNYLGAPTTGNFFIVCIGPH